MRVPLRHFNSIKVRLEQSATGFYCCFEEFQFHKGTIRTNRFGFGGVHDDISIP